MAKLSTIVILAGVVLLIFPIPPVASALGGIAVILAGLVLRFLLGR